MDNMNKTLAVHALVSLALCYLPGVIAAWVQIFRGTKYSRLGLENNSVKIKYHTVRTRKLRNMETLLKMKMTFNFDFEILEFLNLPEVENLILLRPGVSFLKSDHLRRLLWVVVTIEIETSFFEAFIDKLKSSHTWISRSTV